MTSPLPTPVIALLLALAACNGDKTPDTGTPPGTDDTSTTGDVDADGDGYNEDNDCDDHDSSVNPGVEEACDGVDNDCDGEVDEGVTDTWYTDADGDGFGDDGSTAQSCEKPDGMVSVSGDCNDDDSAYHPGADEDDCTDPNDYNCDGSVGYQDGDHDGYAACEECDDKDANVNPGANEVCDGEDNDCDTLVDDDDDSLVGSSGGTWYTDSDGDGYGDPATGVESCEQPPGTVANNTDCKDSDDDIHPGADEHCDGVDEDCDGVADDDVVDGSTYYEDSDRDGYGDASSTTRACSQPTGYTTNDDDCDDSDDDINPDATEVCDGKDNDCDRAIDDADRSLDESTTDTWYADDDGDTYGDDDSSVDACSAPSGYISDDNDCDDSDDDVNPGETEVCDGKDNDCDGKTDDADSSLDKTTTTTWYDDDDSDGYGDASDSGKSCTVPSGAVTDNTDCDDTVATTNPGADEICDSVDNDCDGAVDNDAIDGDWYPTDNDGDGFGSDTDVEWACDGAVNNWDCNDANAGEPQVVDASADPTSADGTITDPWTRVQDGIDEADECVIVYPATYYESIDFTGKDIYVRGTEGPALTVIDATGLGSPVVTFASSESDAAVLRGFTLTGGAGFRESSSSSYSCGSSSTCTDHYESYCGGGLYIAGADPTLLELIVLGNSLPDAAYSTDGTDSWYTYSFGGGACLLNATVAMTGVHFWTNYSDQGGALYADENSSVSHERSWLIANSATDGGAYMVDGGELTLTNVASTWNSAEGSTGGALLVDGTLDATNVLWGEDDAADVGGVYASGASSATIMNSIFYGANTGYGVMVDSGSSFSGSYNNNYGNVGGKYSGITDPTGSSGNISGNPRFTDVTDDGDPMNDDWTLKSTSASLNAGNPAAAYKDTDGTTNDQGAFGGPKGDWD